MAKSALCCSIKQVKNAFLCYFAVFLGLTLIAAKTRLIRFKLNILTCSTFMIQDHLFPLCNQQVKCTCPFTSPDLPLHWCCGVPAHSLVETHVPVCWAPFPLKSALGLGIVSLGLRYSLPNYWLWECFGQPRIDCHCGFAQWLLLYYALFTWVLPCF